MTTPSNKTSVLRTIEWAWRGLIFLVTVGLLVGTISCWKRWEGLPGWQRSNDVYLQTEQTPISARVAGYLRAVPMQDYQLGRADAALAEIDDYRGPVGQAEAGVGSARAQADARRAQRPLLEANARTTRAAVDSAAAKLAQNTPDVDRQGQSPAAWRRAG
jgi:membrane fusion protein (multidrug efflux system)